MAEEVNVREFPKPTQNQVVIKNPLFEKTEEIKKMKQLPPAEQAKFINEGLMGSFEKVEIVAVSETIAVSGSYKPGDVIFTTLQLAEAGAGVSQGKYLLIRESSILGKW